MPSPRRSLLVALAAFIIVVALYAAFAKGILPPDRGTCGYLREPANPGNDIVECRWRWAG